MSEDETLWYLLVNVTNLHPQAVRAYRGQHVREVEAYGLDGYTAVLEWVCEGSERAQLQAEILWLHAIPALLTRDPAERSAHLTSLLQ